MNIIHLTAEKIHPFLQEIAALRIACFREFPYLYEGSFSYEEAYLKTFSETPHAMLMLVEAEGKVVGFSSGVPLNSECDIVKNAKDLFLAHHLNPAEYFYYGELIVLPKYRQAKTILDISRKQDAYARSLGFTRACFLTVMREKDDPRKPKDYRSLEPIWQRNGYARMHLSLMYEWPTLQANGSVMVMENSLEFWQKSLKTCHASVGWHPGKHC